MAMAMQFEVGVDERHTVRLTYDKFWGGLSITVDGETVIRTTLMFGGTLVKSHNFSVGVTEVHQVQIDHHRMALLAGFRPQPIFAFVDGQLVAQAVA